jgi:hypothetical protein
MRIPVVLILCSAFLTGGWGPRGHQSANRAAMKSIPPDGPAFLLEFEDWIAKTGPIPDSWRGAGEPYSKLFEDPNHGWFKEQFAFMSEIPRSRYEFVLRLYDEYLRIKDKDPARAALTNVRWTGTLPYAAMENFDRIKSSMRLYRTVSNASTAQGKQDARYLAQDIAFYTGWLGHYTADGAMPLHDSIHHDGWVGDNPKGYTTDGHIHGRFESAFVELIQLTDADLLALVPKAKRLDDPFAAIIHHLDDAGSHVQEVYELDRRGALSDPKSAQATQLVEMQLSKGAALLRDLVYTAWLDSADRVTAGNPASISNPKYNRATGTAPPDGAPIPYRPN